MKTVQDAVKEFPDGWPFDGHYSIVECVKVYGGGFKVGDLDTHYNDDDGELNDYWRYVCTREEFEAEVARVERIADEQKEVLEAAGLVDKSEWYDCENQKALSLPPVGSKVQLYNEVGLEYGIDHLNGEVEIVHNLEDEGVSVVRLSWGLGCFDMTHLRPVDFNKNKARDEWVEKARGFSNLSLNPHTVGLVYDALKSGELSKP